MSLLGDGNVSFHEFTSSTRTVITRSLHCLARESFKNLYCVTVVPGLKLLPIPRLGGANEI